VNKTSLMLPSLIPPSASSSFESIVEFTTIIFKVFALKLHKDRKTKKDKETKKNRKALTVLSWAVLFSNNKQTKTKKIAVVSFYTVLSLSFCLCVLSVILPLFLSAC
jgi:hypothetical protein